MISINRLPDLELNRETDGDFVGYLHRWCLVPRNADQNVYLHNILSADEPMFHDHPWSFRSIILAGGYREQTPDGDTWRMAGDSFSRQATDLHRIAEVLPGTWSLVRTGPVVRDWGFIINGTWVDWRDERAQVREVQSIARNGYFEAAK